MKVVLGAFFALVVVTLVSGVLVIGQWFIEVIHTLARLHS